MADKKRLISLLWLIRGSFLSIGELDNNKVNSKYKNVLERLLNTLELKRTTMLVGQVRMR